MTIEGNLQIARSTIAEAEIGGLIRENYRHLPSDATCLFEYRGVNDIFRYTNGSLSFFFKMYARKDIDRAAIEAEVEVINHLSRSGLPVSEPIPRTNTEYLLPIQTPEGTRYGLLFTEALGSPCSGVLDEAETVAIARLLSDMHSMLDTLPSAPKRWRLDEAQFLDRSIEILGRQVRFNPQIDMVFLEQVVKELKHQLRTQGSRWNWGLCHGDAFFGNIHRQEDGALTIYDFDFCGYGWRAYDVAVFTGIFSAGLRDKVVDQRKRRLEYFLRGYQHAGGLSDSEAAAVFRIFVPFRRIFNMGYLYESLAYVWGNRFRNEHIVHDLSLLRAWMDHYG